MTNEELNTRLYEKMFAEQEQFRDWLLSQPPAEILNHAYEYTVREDILMSLEYHDLEDSQARALLKSDKPLKQIFERWENQETSYMDTVWDGYVKGAVFFYAFLRFRSHRTGKAGGPAHLPANLRTPGAGPCVRQRLLYQDP